MYILGDLIVLGTKENYLPLPWWNRAPLAFESGTSVIVDLLEPTENGIGDILVSVLDSNKRDTLIRLECSYQDEAGVMNKIFKTIAKLKMNIALAESATISSRTEHTLDLICEVKGSKIDVQKVRSEIEKQGFTVLTCEKLHIENERHLAWQRKKQVQNGWIELKGWKEQIGKQLQKGNISPNTYDLDRVVVSADTDKRLLRYVFPKKGAVNLKIQHADDPGVLAQITAKIKKAHFNILSSLLKRGGVISGDAVLIAVVEPVKVTATDVDKNIERIKAILDELDGSLRIDVRAGRGRNAKKVVYTTNRNSYIVTPPERLIPRMTSIRDELERGKKSVFLSRRFVKGNVETISNVVKSVLSDNSIEVIEANIDSGSNRTSLDEVSAHMWCSDAAIILVSKPDHDEKNVAFSLNLAHEFGFFHGQAKPLLLLIEDESSVLNEVETFSNLKGITAPRFDPENEESIKERIVNWLRGLKWIKDE